MKRVLLGLVLLACPALSQALTVKGHENLKVAEPGAPPLIAKTSLAETLPCRT